MSGGLEIGGRYRLVERVGEGGMGVVHEAYDNELDRVVAIKEIRRRRAKSTRARARLRREAAAMAQLSHPNVVRVFDVVDDAEGVFVVMEYVDGETLDLHLTQAGLDWRTIVPLFTAIGYGLAAIHARGLVHRDFKPTNVLIGDDGVPRVTDFGLVQFPGESSPATSEEVESGERRDLLSPLTGPGMVAGTPRYMPPEQHAGNPVDAKADQYAFCLAFWEALAGHVPFRGQDLEHLAAAKRDGLPRSAALPAPARITSALRRGLNPLPQGRWASMHHLLAALERGQKRRAQMWWLLVPIGAVAGIVALSSGDEGTGCRDPQEALASVWSPAQRDGLAATLENAKPQITGATARQLLDSLDAWSVAWIDGYERACVSDPGADRDTVLACLRQHRARLGGTVDVLQTEDPGLLRRGLEMMAGLPGVEACWEDARPGATPDDAGRQAVLERAVARAEAFAAAGKHREALDAAAGVESRLPCAEFPEHCVRLRMVHGRAYSDAGRFEDAARSYEEAYSSALRAGDDENAAHAALALAFNYSAYRPRRDVARRWLEHADSLAQRVDDAPAKLRASVASMNGRLDMQSGDMKRGVEHARRGLELCLRAHDDVECSHALSTLGWALDIAGDYSAAEEVMRRSLAATEAEVGPDHPDAAKAAGDLAHTLEQLGRDAEVLQLVQRQYETAVRVHGPGHPEALSSKTVFAKQLADRDQTERARKMIAEALDESDRSEAPDYVRASLYSIDAYIDSGRGEHRKARSNLLRGLEIMTDLIGDDHPFNAGELMRLAAEERAMGRYERAHTELKKAEAVVDDRNVRAMLYRDWTLLHLEEGNVDEAEATLARAEAAWSERPWLDAPVAGQRAYLYGMLALARGSAEVARAHLRNARTLTLGVLVLPERRLAYALASVRASLAAGDRDEALALLEAAEPLAVERRPIEQLAEYDFLRARALWPTHREAARRSLTRAQDRIQKAEGGYPLRAEITMWQNAPTRP